MMVGVKLSGFSSFTTDTNSSIAFFCVIGLFFRGPPFGLYSLQEGIKGLLLYGDGTEEERIETRRLLVQKSICNLEWADTDSDSSPLCRSPGRQDSWASLRLRR